MFFSLVYCQLVGKVIRKKMFDEDVNSNRKYYKREEEEEDLAYVEIPDRHYRYGGAQVEDDEEEDARRKREERERKKAEVRKRLEEAGRAKKAKKGFLTPERKKKLRQLLMKKAAEDLKQQQLLKEQERQRILQERIIPLPDVDSINNQSELEKIASQFVKRIAELEELKYDLEYSVRQKDFEINELTIQVNDLRGKFVKPTLKKVSKYDNKFKKFAAKKEEKVDFRANLKIVKKDVTEELKKEKEEKAPEWAVGKKGERMLTRASDSIDAH
ncbi:Troponin I 3 [Trichinella pseudospiralis]|uniref:Troponin I 3 n=8 Tax=Trichinella TaxID=6333 RepID=A0A0V0XL13_TRIPS|nr:Troponin I 3 [Trichinella pseudospiralis]